MQNLVVVNVPAERAARLERDAAAAGLRLGGSPFRRGTVACTGSEFCKLALTETKAFARWLVEDLEARLPGFQDHVRINVTGCPNSCGQHWIADIGIEGKKVKVDGSAAGRLLLLRRRRGGPAPGGRAADRRPRPRHPRAGGGGAPAARLISRQRRPGQTFRAFCAAHTDDELRTFLAGPEVPAEARDAPAGPVPHGVDG